jgi:hypothetical protein
MLFIYTNEKIILNLISSMYLKNSYISVYTYNTYHAVFIQIFSIKIIYRVISFHANISLNGTSHRIKKTLRLKCIMNYIYMLDWSNTDVYHICWSRELSPHVPYFILNNSYIFTCSSTSYQLHSWCSIVSSA